jgi:hypothetical protein
MAETSWTEEQAPGPKKKSIPTWLWFCGGGCLLAVLLAVIAAGFGIRAVNQARNPEVQWPKVAEILPFDERPEGWTLIMGVHIVGDQYTFQVGKTHQVQFQNHPGKDGTQARKELFGSDKPRFPQNMGVMKFDDLASASVLVQGRELRLFRTRMQFAGVMDKMMPDEARDAMGSMVFIDLTPEGREGMLLGQITRFKDAEPIPDEEIQDLLAPFHVGPDR